MAEKNGIILFLALSLAVAPLAGCRDRSSASEVSPPGSTSEHAHRDTPGTAEEGAPESFDAGLEPSEVEADGIAREQTELPGDAGAIRVDTAPQFSQIDPAVDEALTSILAKWPELETIQAKLVTRLSQKDEPKTEHSGEGERFQSMRDGTFRLRSNLLTEIKVWRTEEERAAARAAGEDDREGYLLTFHRVLRVYDGEHFYQLIVTHEGAMAVKRLRPGRGALQPIAGPQLVAALRSAATLERRPDQEVDGHTVYVLKASHPSVEGSVKYYVDKELGVLRRLERHRPERSRRFSLELTDIVLNEDISADTWVFDPPEGVEIQDLTAPGADAPGDEEADPLPEEPSP